LRLGEGGALVLDTAESDSEEEEEDAVRDLCQKKKVSKTEKEVGTKVERKKEERRKREKQKHKSNICT
jgi:hypothetical protein